MLNRYVYECFFVNQLLPLIREYLSTQAPAALIERNLFCDKNVIDEICRYPLPEHYQDLSNYDEISKALRRINHFKELGRASYSNPINMFEEAKTEEHKNMIEINLNRPIREAGGLNALFKQNALRHYEVHTCPCCGTNALTTFEFWKSLETQKVRVESAECSVCTYKINANIGEPKEFGIIGTDLFTYIEEVSNAESISD